jgi:hypothetical protein
VSAESKKLVIQYHRKKIEVSYEIGSLIGDFKAHEMLEIEAYSSQDSTLRRSN